MALIFLSPLDPVYSISKESLRHIVNKNINMLKRAFLGVVKYDIIMCVRCILPVVMLLYCLHEIVHISVSINLTSKSSLKHKSFIVYVSIMLMNQYRLQGDIFLYITLLRCASLLIKTFTDSVIIPYDGQNKLLTCLFSMQTMICRVRTGR